ncbi:unnamed protein product [Auanema sp. JU1783]|nr:unnamed protein product [Auanema sp. JU1783]
MSTADVERCDPTEVYGGAHLMNITCPPFTVYDHYLGSCVPASLIQFADQENEPAMYAIYGYVLLLLSLIVLLSHGLVIYVLKEQKSKRASVEPLLFMAISALFMAIAPLPFTIYYYNLGHLADLNQTLHLCYLQKLCMETFPFFFNTLITFFTMLLGIQRFIAIQYPLDSFRWCARRQIRFYSKIILFVSCIITLVHYMFDIRVIYHFCITNGPQSLWVARCFVGYSDVTRSLGAGVLSTIFDVFRICITLVPSIFLLVITFLLIRTVRATDKTFIVSKSNKNISTINRHKKITSASRKTTVMLTVIIVLFLVGRLPSTILILVMKIADFFEIPALEIVYDAYLRAFTNIIMMTVHPISFAVYMLMSRRFRVSLRRKLGWRFLATDEELRAFNSTNRIHSIGANIRYKESTFPLLSYRLESENSSYQMTTICSARQDSRKGVAFSPEIPEEEENLTKEITKPL